MGIFCLPSKLRTGDPGGEPRNRGHLRGRNKLGELGVRGCGLIWFPGERRTVNPGGKPRAAVTAGGVAHRENILFWIVQLLFGECGGGSCSGCGNDNNNNNNSKANKK